MEDLLFTLCRICNVHEAKYTCPRCSIQTCSLPCSRRHKIWASCSGIRDPTVYKPKSQLATPSGIDHDYNFLHSIEHRIERSQKLIVEERELVDEDELALARAGTEDHNRKRRKQGPQRPGEEPIQRALKRTRTTILRAPKGMRRNLENETTWSAKGKSIHWQVEWIREGDAGRILSRAMGKSPIGDVYAIIMEQERKRGMSDEERKLNQPKTPCGGSRSRRAKRMQKAGRMKDLILSTPSILQDPETGSWCLTSGCTLPTELTQGSKVPQEPRPTLPATHHLYLLRPRTPSSYPKVLVPLDPTQSLEVILRGRLVLEFPTIYVFCCEPKDIPREFVLESDFLVATGEAKFDNPDTEMDDAQKDSRHEDSDSDTPTSDSDTSTSGSDSDEIMEDGEITEVVPAVWVG